MTRNESVLVEYWLRIGKVRRERRDIHGSASGYRYYFQNTEIEFELQDTWIDFFRAMNTQNHLYFLAGIEGAQVVEGDSEIISDILPFDPWEDPNFISLEIPFSRFEFQGKNKVYRCIEVLKNVG